MLVAFLHILSVASDQQTGDSLYFEALSCGRKRQCGGFDKPVGLRQWLANHSPQAKFRFTGT